MANVTFLGLGVMGFPMAGHLVSSGHQVTVFNRTLARAEAWAKSYKGLVCGTPAEAAANAEIVFSCVGNDDDLRSIIYGDQGALQSMHPGTIFIDHTTASAEVAREIAERAAERRIQFLDAPVSGGQAGAESGKLTVMVGGDAKAFDHAKPVIDAYARTCVLMGPVGSGQLSKMVNQICIAGLLQGLAEGLNFSMRAGLDGAKLVDVISKGAAQSWQMDNRAKTMLENKFDFGFAVDWMLKDLSICLDEGKRNGARLPITSLIQQFYFHVRARGGGRWDTSSLIELVARDS